MRNTKFLTLLLTILSIHSSFVWAQEPLQHQKKVYLSPEGKMYINKDLPLYFWVSTTGENNSQKFLLNPSDDSKPYVNPSYMDTEGYNTFRSPSKVDTITKETIMPESDIIWELYADSKPPVTNFSFDNQTFYKNSNIYYFNNKIELLFKTKDETSGVEATFYSINGAPYKELKESIRIENETLQLIKFYSVDNVGNVETAKEIQIRIDITKPVTNLEVEGDIYNNILSPRSAIKLTSTDDNSNVKSTFYAFNEGAFSLYRQPVATSNLKEGDHTITYYSVDNSGNEEDKKSYSFYLDKTPPMLVDELIGNTFIANGKEYSSGRSKIKLTAMDNKSGVKEIRYSINNGEFISYDQPFYLSKSGQLKIQTFAIDNVNNQSISTIMTDKTNISFVDLNGPVLGHAFEGPSFISRDTTYITKNTKIRLSAKDDAAGYKHLEYNINNEPNQQYSKSFSVETDGQHVINYTGYDNVDNSNSNTFIVVVDNVGPQVFFRFSIVAEKKQTINDKSYDVYPSHVVLFLSSTDMSVGYEKMFYSINGAAPKQYTSLISDFQKNKTYKIDVTSIDKLGNKSTESIEFFIE
ncbi:MAG: hypothetical protein A2W99_15065 [Bacteroidetes bacterium GWF2_33_16]|nr:MAG: hypothetical protein A2X00_00020 [Bacteroidetes bacterium GWE2_32_14]OFY07646.1 MAG: hypothetical protein A2W99_15065 [Bacteroidetes bacterium GWF2_33_16]